MPCVVRWCACVPQAPTLNDATGALFSRMGVVPTVCVCLGADPQRRDRAVCAQVRVQCVSTPPPPAPTLNDATGGLCHVRAPRCVLISPCPSACASLRVGPPDVPRSGVSGRATCLPDPTLVPPALGPAVPAPCPARARSDLTSQVGALACRCPTHLPNPRPRPTPARRTSDSQRRVLRASVCTRCVRASPCARGPPWARAVHHPVAHTPAHARPSDSQRRGRARAEGTTHA